MTTIILAAIILALYGLGYWHGKSDEKIAQQEREVFLRLDNCVKLAREQAWRRPDTQEKT